jgi:hypothetical protein
MSALTMTTQLLPGVETYRLGLGLEHEELQLIMNLLLFL